MFVINEDKSIYVTRGDIVLFSVMADEDGKNHVFKKDDVVRFKVFEKKACENVVLQKDTLVEADTESVEIILSRHDTKIGEVISKPTDYWYEVELNPFTDPQTIVGYDDDGPKVFKLYPEGADISSIEEPEDIPLVDDELDKESTRPIQNQAVAKALESLVALLRKEFSDADIKALLDYVKNTDYATKTKGGVVKVGTDAMGVKLNADNTLVIAGAGVSEIQSMASANRPITPYYLKHAIKTGLSKNDLEWTEEEKENARRVLGVSDGVTVVDNLLSTATNLPLSANQGRVINERVDQIVTTTFTDIPSPSVVTAHVLLAKVAGVKTFTFGGATNQVLEPNWNYGLFQVSGEYKNSIAQDFHILTGGKKLIYARLDTEGVLYLTPFERIDAGELIRCCLTYI